MPDPRSTEELIKEFTDDPGLEGETIDFKSKEKLGSTAQKKDLVKNFAEMANNRGGSIIIGVRLEEEELLVQDFSVDSEYKQEISHIIQQYASSHLSNLCDFRFEKYRDKKILRVDIEEATELVKVDIDGEWQCRIRDLDGGREMTSGEISDFYQQPRQSQFVPNITEIRKLEEIELKNNNFYSETLNTFNQRPTIRLDTDEYTAIFVNGIPSTTYAHTHTYRLDTLLDPSIEYTDSIGLLRTVSEQLGGDLQHGFGYTFRWGDTQVVGRSINALVSDIGDYGNLRKHLSETGEVISNYQPILACAIKCDYGILWFELQRETKKYVRGKLQLVAPDIPVNSSAIEQVFSEYSSVPQAYEQRAGTQILRYNITGSNELKNPNVRSMGSLENFEIENVVCDNPLRTLKENESKTSEIGIPQNIKKDLSQIHRLPFDIAGGYVVDAPDRIIPQTIEAMLLYGTFPTLIIEPRATQYDPHRGDPVADALDSELDTV